MSRKVCSAHFENNSTQRNQTVTPEEALTESAPLVPEALEIPRAT